MLPLSLRRAFRMIIPGALAAALLIPTTAAQGDAQALPPIGDDYPWTQIMSTFPYEHSHDVLQCGVFALWRIDRDKRLPALTTLIQFSAAPDAGTIDDVAPSLGYRVDSTPTVGSLGIQDPGEHGTGRDGHAFYVARVFGWFGPLLVEQYNRPVDYRYSWQIVPRDWARAYVHF